MNRHLGAIEVVLGAAEGSERVVRQIRQINLMGRDSVECILGTVEGFAFGKGGFAFHSTDGVGPFNRIRKQPSNCSTEPDVQGQKLVAVAKNLVTFCDVWAGVPWLCV